MVEKDKNIEKTENKTDSSQNKNKTGKKSRVFAKYFYMFLILLIAAAALFLFKDNIKVRIQKYLPKSKAAEETLYTKLKDDIDFHKNTIQNLSKQVAMLEKEYRYNTDTINYLQSKIDELQDNLEKMNINPQRIELIRTALNIQNEINNNISYSNNLTVLKSLSKGDNFLLQKIAVLEQYQNTSISRQLIEKDFKTEFNSFIKENNILKKKDNGFLNFLSNFITVRKTNNVEDNSYDEFLLQLETAINTKNYSLASMILENSIYSDDFSTTASNIKTVALLNSTIEEIINYLVNNQ